MVKKIKKSMKKINNYYKFKLYIKKFNNIIRLFKFSIKIKQKKKLLIY